MQLSLIGRTPLGRGKVKLEWQVAPLGTFFTDTGVITGTSVNWTDVLTTGVTITQNVSGLTQTQAYHWRIRLLYHNGNRSGQVASRWIHVPWNGWNEQGFRSRATMAIRTTVIAYTYDPLYRLTGANYSGAYTYTFAYDYDKVGNREAFTRTITNTIATTYTFDAANRLATQNGQSLFAWDNNGNLLTDGNAVYAYDFANRLISTTVSSVNTQFGYNGNGARLRLIESGVATTYTQDLAAGLPVVLQAKTGSATMQYIYSMGTRPLAEYDGAWEYLLADGLGSVRQIADANGDVTLAKSYQPYGEVLNSAGTATSIFGYSGEQIDTTGLVFLRARYMYPGLGSFLSRDLWKGNVLRPGSMNGWNYVGGNPIGLIDPTGLMPWIWDVRDGSQEYTCNCGWIDWNHADPYHAKQAIDGVEESLRLKKDGLTIFLEDRGPGDMYFGFILAGFWIDTNRVEELSTSGLGAFGGPFQRMNRSMVIRQMALGIYQNLQNFFEGFQGGNGNPQRGLLDAIAQSSFSEEDLTSDLIGFYRALWQENPNDTGSPFARGYSEDRSREEVRRLCRVVGLEDDDATRIQKQVEIFTRYKFPPVNGFQDQHEWGNPRLVDLTSAPIIPFNTLYDTGSFCWSRFCTEPNRGFPSEFSQVRPIGEGSLWGLGAVWAHVLGKDTLYLP